MRFLGTAFGAVLVFALCAPLFVAAAEKEWMTDFAAAQEKTRKEGKDLLVNFSGSDWCGWCIRLDEEVFSQEPFLSKAKENFVLVLVDRPKAGATPEAQKLIDKYEIQGYPSVFLMLPDGRPYAKTGYQQGGAENYVKHLDELRAKRKEFVDTLAQMEKGTDAEKQRAVLTVLSECSKREIPPSSVLAGGDSEKMKTLLEKAVQGKPADFFPYYYLGNIKFDKYNWKEAAPLFEEAYKYKTADTSVDCWADALMKRANSLFNSYNFAAAKEAFQKVLDCEKDFPGGKIKDGFRGHVQGYVDACGSYGDFLKKEEEIRAAEAKTNDNPQVEIKTDKGAIKLELFENAAPNTVANFISLVEQKFYDGTKFHRVISHFMVQGGDPNSRNDDPSDDGKGDPGYSFADELSGEFRRHFVGSLSMANGGPNTNGSQFFITHVPTHWLNGKHTVFGRVLEGQDIVNKIVDGDKIVAAKVLRKRSHEYKPEVKKNE
jgi:cyclophilin family peptidyl-prolyl cis-trans isomerase